MPLSPPRRSAPVSNRRFTETHRIPPESSRKHESPLFFPTSNFSTEPHKAVNHRNPPGIQPRQPKKSLPTTVLEVMSFISYNTYLLIKINPPIKFRLFVRRGDLLMMGYTKHNQQSLRNQNNPGIKPSTPLKIHLEDRDPSKPATPRRKDHRIPKSISQTGRKKEPPQLFISHRRLSREKRESQIIHYFIRYYFRIKFREYSE